MLGDKFRLRFRKHGDLRLLSHLDLTRCVERMLRRADLPFKSTAGFHPTPRMIFALSLPLGVTGTREVLELELLTPHDAADVQERLNRAAPRGLEFLTSNVVEMKATAIPRRVVYTLPLPPDRVDPTRAATEALSHQEQVWVDRFKPRPRRLNIKQYLRSVALSASPLAGEGVTGNSDEGNRAQLLLDLWVTQNGTARADELVRLLGLQDLLDAGAVIERRELELRDETPPGQQDAPPDGPPETAPMIHPPADAGADDKPTATWGLSPNGPVVE